MKDNQPTLTHHPPETLIAAYAMGKCSQIEQSEIDDHCFTCEECRTRLSILLRLCASEGSEKEQRELEKLFPLGVETIAQVKLPENHNVSQTMAKDVHSLQLSQVQAKSTKKIKGMLGGFLYLNRKLLIPVTAILLVLAGALTYWHLKLNSPVQSSLNAMRKSYFSSRPLEARVTGDFPYKAYERTRGASDNIDIDRDQINYALLELTRIVASNPTADARHALGRLYLLLRDFDNAENQLNEALKSSPRNAKIHTDLAAVFYERSKYSDTYRLLSSAVKHYESAIEIDSNLAEAWFNRALCYERMSLNDMARDSWKKYLELDANSEWAKEAREHLKKLEARASSPETSKKNSTLSIQNAILSGDQDALRGLVSQNFAQVRLFSTGQLLDDYLAASIKGDVELASAHLKNLMTLGKLAAELKSDRFILDLADFASRASPKAKSGMQSVRLMLRQADKEFARSELDSSYSLYQTAYTTSERLKDPFHSSTAALYLIRFHNIRPNTDHLGNLAVKIASQAEKQHYPYIQAQAYLALANSYLSVYQIAQSLDYSLKAEKITRELGDIESILNSLRYSSGAYARIGDYDRSLSKYFEALSLLRDYPVSQIRKAQMYLQIGETLYRLGDYKIAIEYVKEAIQTITVLNNKVFLAGASGRLALIQWKLGQHNEAIKQLNSAISQSKDIKDDTSIKLLQAELYTTLGDVQLDQKNADDSIQSYKKAFLTVKGTNYKTYLAAIHQGLAGAFLAQGKTKEAEAELINSISQIEKERKFISDSAGRTSFLSSRQNVYRAMVDFQYTAKNDITSAFNYSEILKSRDLLDALSQVPKTETINGQIRISLSKSAEPAKLTKIQHTLPANAQILSYAVTDRRLIIWHITKDKSFSAAIEIEAERLQKMTLNYLNSLKSKRDITYTNGQSSDLYKLLIDPVADHLDASRLLCIIPDKSLYQLPFAALYSNLKEKYLVEDFRISIAPSASVLASTFETARLKLSSGDESFLGISNPQFNYNRYPELPPLPSSEEEVAHSLTLYKNGKIFNREMATESNLIKQISKYEIIHIAAHTLVDSQIPLFSSIVLADEATSPATKEKASSKQLLDGKLQALEIYKLKLPSARLVILSSCRSAVGEQNRGEALSALSQAFFASKVPTVISSLWDVDDESTAQIMYAFHKNYRSSKYGFAESLQNAQRKIIHADNMNMRHPYYWAAFQISGDGFGKRSLVN